MTLPSIHDMVRERMEEPEAEVLVTVDPMGAVHAFWTKNSDHQLSALIDAEYAIGANKAELAVEIVRQLKEGT